MKRWLAQLLAAVSLLLALGIGALWIRSVNGLDGAYLTVSDGARPDVVMRFNSIGGAVAIFGWRELVVPKGVTFYVDSTELEVSYNTSPFWGTWQRIRTVLLSSMGPPTPSFGVAFPHWFAEILALSLSLPWLISRRRSAKARRLTAENKCPACGYDLRATPERCPECGTAKT